MKKWIALGLLLAITCVASYAYLWQRTEQLLQQPLLVAAPSPLVEINSGLGARELLRSWTRLGWLQEDLALRFLFRLHPELSRLQAGHYRVDKNMTLGQMLRRIVRGDIVSLSITFIEGWTLRDWRKALARAPLLPQTITKLSDAALAKKLGLNAIHPEGLLFPSTYEYNEQQTDFMILQLAAEYMQRELTAAWATRAPGLPYKDPYQALTMASIVEKETGLASEREKIAGVFIRRLQKGMRLQTDPTVIYGLGAQFDGNLRKVDLQTDTPYNTYTRYGLPITPIAAPGRDAIYAALHPAAGSDLYFVARGDGGHVFSSTLEQHNAAVRQFQIQGRKQPARPPSNTSLNSERR